MPIVALGLLVVSGDAARAGCGPAAVVGLVVFLLALAGFPSACPASGGPPGWAGRWPVLPPPCGGSCAGRPAGLGARRRGLPPPRRPLLRARWRWLTLTTLTSHLSLFLVLLLALRHVRVSESG